MEQKQRKKVLINGCSHTRAEIPDNPKGDPWPKIFGAYAGVDVVNLAQDGKSNHIMIEESIRYIINRDDVDHVVIMLNEWKRINLFRKTASFKWHPDELESQVCALRDDWTGKQTDYVKIPAASNDDLIINRFVGTPSKNTIEIGDRSLMEQRITAGTLMYALFRICELAGIGLTIINMHSIGEALYDATWDSISQDCFLLSNPERGLYNDLCWRHDTPDTFHFEHNAHFEIAKMVTEHYTAGIQVKVTSRDYDREHGIDADRIFDYS